ncbi:NADP-dependent isocitrate dehydrogenase [Bacillus daqingensis]|uniref:Isocitrate dehydrogenase [NADP] n=1 Tax=Bacillus daqingensis TaxID=872396 RepID=A0ABV9NU59_9BACI
MGRTPVTVARGDGIGPEIMDAVLRILEAADAPIEPEYIDIGKEAYLNGWTTGITDDAWKSLNRTKLFLKAPITTPQGGGYKSLNVTIRTTLGLYANVRPTMSLAPFVKTKHPEMDLVVIRENEEDLYTGIEYQQTPEVVQSMKLITRPGTERIVRYAFDYAKKHGRKKVTCITKDNIMKRSDGLFHKVFEEVANEYPELETDHWIVDIGLAKIADTPEDFDVVVMPNLYGDIGSDIAAQISGSVGLAGSANVGDEYAMFEAIHGSAPDIAGKGIANPSGLLNGAVQLLLHIGEAETAENIQNAWLKTLEDGVHTGDIAKGGKSVGSKEFADAVIERLGSRPEKLQAVSFEATSGSMPEPLPKKASERAGQPPKRELDGVDVYVYNKDLSADQLAMLISRAAEPDYELSVITNRGVNAYPTERDDLFTTDHWRCRLLPAAGVKADHEGILKLLARLTGADVDWIQVQNLYSFDQTEGYSEAKRDR